MDNLHGSQHSFDSINTIRYAATAKLGVLSSFWLFTFVIIGCCAYFQLSDTLLNNGILLTKVNKFNLKTARVCYSFNSMLIINSQHARMEIFFDENVQYAEIYHKHIHTVTNGNSLIGAFSETVCCMS